MHIYGDRMIERETPGMYSRCQKWQKHDRNGWEVTRAIQSEVDYLTTVIL